MDEERIFSLQLSAAEAGLRLDRALAQRLPQFSRTALQGWLRAGCITVDAAPAEAAAPVAGGECVQFHLPEPAGSEVTAEAIPLAVVFEDETLIVVNKPAGLVVHPGAGCPAGTLQNGLLHYAPELSALPRAGIVHRLDKDTSGLLVIARTEVARLSLIEQLKTREMGREYLALVIGTPTAQGFVEAPIGRDARHRTRMSVRRDGRAARTDYTVVERFTGYSLVRLKLHSGRTHQIRVHMSHIGFPLVGDEVYGGGRSRHIVNRQALHARRLALCHPRTGAPLVFEAALPADLEGALAALRAGAPP